jgi:hypothetical protein
MKFEVIENNKLPLAQKEINEFETLLKLHLLGGTTVIKQKKIVDISCFYGISVEDLITIINKVGG